MNKKLITFITLIFIMICCCGFETDKTAKNSFLVTTIANAHKQAPKQPSITSHIVETTTQQTKEQLEDYNKHIDYLSRVMAHECYSHEYYDMLCVGMTIMNRVDSGRFPNDIYSVVMQPNQMEYSYGYIDDIYIQAATEVYNAYLNNKQFDSGYTWINTLFWGASGGTTNVFY